MSESSPIQYNWIDGVERLELYEPGGYHPVRINDRLHNRYRILDKLGHGGYSTIWFARDEQAHRYVAVKIGTASISTPWRESGILQALRGSQSTSQPSADALSVKANPALPRVLDTFDVHGPNGTHACYTLEPAQGNLQEAALSRLFPVRVARALSAKLAATLAFVHAQGYVHGALDELSIPEFVEKYGDPEGVSITRVDGRPLTPNVPERAMLPLELGKSAKEFTLADAQSLLLSDFGEAFSPATEQRLGKHCKTIPNRIAPEVLFEPNTPLSYPADIWSLGITIWEILGMKSIFSDWEGQDVLVAQQIEVFGDRDFPKRWREQWERQGEGETEMDDVLPRKPTQKRQPWPHLDINFEETVQKYRRQQEHMGVFEEAETSAILELMRGMFRFRPEDRLTADEVLRSKWMVKWALPELD